MGFDACQRLVGKSLQPKYSAAIRIRQQLLVKLIPNDVRRSGGDHPRDRDQVSEVGKALREAHLLSFREADLIRPPCTLAASGRTLAIPGPWPAGDKGIGGKAKDRFSLSSFSLS